MRRRILIGVGAVFVFLGAIIIFLSYSKELWANASWSPEVVALGLSSVALGLGWWSLSK
jgi:lipopolysaccharide export LptBFGC system permease protein LptF